MCQRSLADALQTLIDWSCCRHILLEWLRTNCDIFSRVDSTAFFTACDKHQWQLRAGACLQPPFAFACSISQCLRLLREDVFMDEKNTKKNIGATSFTLTLCFPEKMGLCITSDLLYCLSLKHTIGLSTGILIRSWSNMIWKCSIAHTKREMMPCPTKLYFHGNGFNTCHVAFS